MTPDDEDRTGDPDGTVEPASPPPGPARPPWDAAGVDAAFADIVARLQSDGVDSGPAATGPPATGSATTGPASPGPAVTGPAATGPPADAGSQRPGGDASPDPAADAAAIARRRRIEREVDAAVDGPDGGHYVPPEPTPLPRPDAITLLAWVAVIGGPLVLIAGTMLGGLPTWLTGTVVAAVVVGFVLLVSRLPRRGDVDPGDDGAVV